jgi:glycosyltransferase involved in cell wall biosynthesis
VEAKPFDSAFSRRKSQGSVSPVKEAPNLPQPLVGMNRMRVIVLNDYGHVAGGAAQVAISSLNGLAENGLDVIFVSSVGPIDPAIRRDIVNVVNFGLDDLLENSSRIQAAVMGIWDWRCAARFREVLAGCDPADTIVHLHSWVKSLSSSVVQTAISLGFRVVCTLHDYFSVCPNGGLYNFPQQKPCLLRPMSLDCVASNCDSRSYAQKLWRVGRQVVQNSFGGIPRLQYFITVSDYSESLLRRWLPPTAEFFRVRNPIEIERMTPSAVDGNRAFTFVGRISTEKGPGVFAEAARLANVRAVFVGSGPREDSLAAINTSAELLGWQDRPDVVRAIRASRATVFPSIWHETQGMVVLEAAALGVPAIVSDSCAAKEAIVDGETGLLFRAGDASDLSMKLTLLDRDSELAARLGLTAYERYWSAPSTIEMHTKQLIACYTEIMERPK